MHRTSLISFVLAGATAFTAAACGSSGDIKGGGDDDGNGIPDAGGRADARSNGPTDPNMPTDPNAAGCRKMDIVFVVDDSGSMKQEQDNLGVAFDEFAKILDAFVITTGEHLDYRVALTTTDRSIYYWYTAKDRRGRLVRADEGGTYKDGAFRRLSTMAHAWIESGDATRALDLEMSAQVGTEGSFIEMPLEAARLALSPDSSAAQANNGFLREDALLATVLLTDEEDCSRPDGRTPQERLDASRPDGSTDYDQVEAEICDHADKLTTPQAYVDFFDKLKGGRGRWATAVIAGGEKACESKGFGKAEASPRLIEFTKLTGKNAVFHSICDGDLAPALKEALNTFQQACNNIPPVD